MKESRLFRIISMVLSFMLVMTMLPFSALAEGENGDPGELLGAQSIEPTTYTVEFRDWNGTLIDTVSVEQGGDATAPAHPTRDGYVANGWDTDFTNVQSDLTVVALYTEVVVNIYIYVGNGFDNEIQHYVMHAVISSKIAVYGTLFGIDLLHLLQADTNYALAGASGEIPNSDLTGNGQIALEDSAPVYNVYVHIKEKSALTSYTVRYHDTAGNELKPDYNSPKNPKLYVGDSVTVTAPDISGYTLLSASPKTITLNYSDNVVTFVYTPTAYTINYVLGGGSNNAGNPSTYTKFSDDITLKDPSRAGYNFVRWNPIGSIPSGSTGDKTFTAIWSDPIEYKIEYVLGGGTNHPTNPSKYTVNSAEIVLKDPTWLGHQFLGWDPVGTIPSGSYGDKTFTAKWSAAIVYQIEYVLNEGTNNLDNPASYTVDTETFTLKDPTRAGYDFLGWNPTSTTVTKGSTGDLKFTANWSDPVEYTIEYVLGGGTNNEANPATYTVNTETFTLKNPTRAGYNFLGWDPDDITVEKGSTGNLKFTALWSDPIVYQIEYVLNDGTNNLDNPATYTVNTDTFTLKDPTRLGYNFLGWDPEDITVEKGSTGDLKFTANWSDPVEYTIEYVLSGGTNNEANPATYTVNTETFTLGNPTRLGYNFLGWDPEDTTIEKGSTGNLKFTALWSDPIVYNITYVMNGGTNAPANPATYTVESAAITLVDPAQPGYIFLGWTPNATIPAGSTGNVTFTANWSAPIVYGIAYVMNGGVNPAANPATYTVVSPTITLAAPAQLGYAFLGWTPAGVIPTGSVGARTFTANWSAPIVYDITYVLNGGTNAPANPATYTVESGLITLQNPTRPGYTFLGWTPAGSIPAGSTGDVTFTANWSDPIQYTVTYFVTGGTEAGLDGATPYAEYTNVVYGAAVPVPEDPAQDGYTFDGWDSDIPATMPEGNLVFRGIMTAQPVQAEVIADEPTPLAGPSWALLNLILTVLTVLGIGTMFTMLGKKRNETTVKKGKVFRLSTLIPAAGAVVAFLLTENLKNPMALTDQWTILMAAITLVQGALIALGLGRKAKKA